MSKNSSTSLLIFAFICTVVARLSSLFLFNILIVFLLASCASPPPAKVREESYGGGQIPNTYRVIPGDTLFSIAWRYGLKYENLAKINHISPPYIIKPSQLIRLSAGGSAAAKHDAKSFLVKKNSSGLGRSINLPTPKTGLVSKNNKTAESRNLRPQNMASQSLVWGWPSEGAVLSRFQSNNGLNKGVDIGGDLGEPVLAAASGRVVYAGSGLRGYGKLLIIKHSESFLSAYAHNSQLLVKEGDLVKAGQRIADMGSSGTDRVKLHFEIRREGTPVDPLVYLPKK